MQHNDIKEFKKKKILLEVEELQTQNGALSVVKAHRSIKLLGHILEQKTKRSNG